MDKVLYAEFN